MIVYGLILAAILVPPITAVGGPQGAAAPGIDHATVSIQAGTRGGGSGAGLDINLSTLFLNGGLNVRSWNRREKGADGDGSRSEASLFAGVGLATILQIQAGYSFDRGLKIRLRSDLPFTPTDGTWRQFKQGSYWVVSPVIEVPLAAHQGTLFGLGLGRAF